MSLVAYPLAWATHFSDGLLGDWFGYLGVSVAPLGTGFVFI